MPPNVETVKVVCDWATDGFQIINKADFKEGEHKLYVPVRRQVRQDLGTEILDERVSSEAEVKAKAKAEAEARSRMTEAEIRAADEAKAKTEREAAKARSAEAEVKVRADASRNKS